MQLPVLLKHVEESGIVARAKQYEINAHHFLVDVEDDAKVFIEQGFVLVKEGEDAVKRFAELQPKQQKKSTKSTKAASTAKDENKAAD